MSKHKYNDCSYCGGAVRPDKIKVDFWWKDTLYVFEDVPAGVCQQCGEKYFTASVAKKMEAPILRHKIHWKRVMEVPVSSYSQLISA